MPSLVAPLRGGPFRLLWAGTFVSLVGDGVFLVALAWAVYGVQNALTALSIVGVAMTLPQVLFLLLGGVAGDRFDRRRVLIAADVLRAAAVAALAALAIAGELSLPVVIGIVCVYSVGCAFFGPSFDAMIPSLVPGELLAQANSLDQLARPLAARLVGPALCGVLIGVAGTGAAFVFDAATFVVSAACVLAIPRTAARARPRSAGSGSLLGECREGFTFVRQRVWLWGTFLSATFAYLLFVGPSEVLLPAIVKNELDAGPGTLGAVFSVGGAGAVAAAIVTSSRPLSRRPITFVYSAWTAATLAIAGFGLATHAWHLMVASFVFNAFEAAGAIVWATTKQRLVPDGYLGRVSSFEWFITTGLLPLSFALAAPVAALLGPKATLLGAGLLGAAVTLGFLFLPGMRDIESVDVERAPALDAAGT